MLAVRVKLDEAKASIALDPAGWNLAKTAKNTHELVNASSVRCPVRPVSRSYFKLREIFTDFPDVGRAAQAGHCAMVAEGPGGFAQAALERGCDDVRVVTLVSPTAPRVRVSDRRVRIVTGDGSGDVMRPRVRAAFFAAASGASLYTADGGFDLCGAFEEQEQQSASLIEIEVAMGISVLRPGGALVVKFFDVFDDRSKATLSWIGECFERAYVCKPRTSRPANSERYAVGVGLKPCLTSSALKSWVLARPNTVAAPSGAPQYAAAIDRAGCALALKQTRHIEDALWSKEPLAEDAHLQMDCLFRWCHRHGMQADLTDLRNKGAPTSTGTRHGERSPDRVRDHAPVLPADADVWT
jgi:23S rRNA U2552 (ribose-2'-O)-methylase RlmE/FtsJ